MGIILIPDDPNKDFLELDNGDYEQELNAINEAQSKLYQALKELEID